MNSTPSEVLDALGHCRKAVAVVLREGEGAAARAAGLAAALRGLRPSAAVCACLLQEGGDEAVAAVDAAAAARPEWAEALRGELGRAAAARDPAPADVPAAPPLPPGLVAAPLATPGGVRFGAAAVEAAEGDGEAAALLAAFAGDAAVLLARDEADRDRRRLRADLESLEWAASAGELAGPLAHEVNNAFNVILLQLAVLEQQAPEAARAEVAEVRRQGKAAAALVKRWQQYRRRRPAAVLPLDLNAAVREAVGELRRGPAEVGGPPPVRLVGPAGLEGGAGVPVLLDLAAPSPRAAAAAPDLRRLLMFLVRNAAAAAPEGAVAVRTRRAGDKAVVVVEDTGPSVAADRLTAFFEPGGEAREGADGLELAACHALARRLGGRAAAANLAGGGVAVTVELPAV